MQNLSMSAYHHTSQRGDYIVTIYGNPELLLQLTDNIGNIRYKIHDNFFGDNSISISDIEIMDWSQFRSYWNQEYKNIKVQSHYQTAVKPRTQDGSNSDTGDSDGITINNIEDGNQTGEDGNERNNDEAVALNIGPVEATPA